MAMILLFCIFFFFINHTEDIVCTSVCQTATAISTLHRCCMASTKPL